MTDLQPLETFAFSTSAQRSKIIVDRDGLTSEKAIIGQLELAQLKIIEAKEKWAATVAASPTATGGTQDFKALYDAEADLYTKLVQLGSRYSNDSRNIELRHDLLTFEQFGLKSEKTKDGYQRLKDRLSLNYLQYVQSVPSYEATDDDSEPLYPSVLDQSKFTLQHLLKQRYDSDSSSLNGVHQLGWEQSLGLIQAMSRSNFEPFIRSLTAPTLSNIVDLIIREVYQPTQSSYSTYKYYADFGSSSQVHRLLTHEQLVALREKSQNREAVLAICTANGDHTPPADVRQYNLFESNTIFVNDYILKDAPFTSKKEWTETQANGGLANEVKEKYLEKLWTFATNLPKKHQKIRGSLYFFVLYYTYQLFNTINYDRLEILLTLPRTNTSISYLTRHNDEAVGLNGLTADQKAEKQWEITAPHRFEHPYMLPEMLEVFNITTTQNEQALIEAACRTKMPLPKEVRQAIISPTHYTPAPTLGKGWFAHIDIGWFDRYQARCLLTTHSLSSKATPEDIEQAKTLIGSYEVPQMKSSIRLEFGRIQQTLFENQKLKKSFHSKDEISLPIIVKNIPTLLVKIFHINVRSFYTKMLTELNASNLELDGLTPIQELRYDYATEEKDQGWNEYLIQEKVLKLDLISKATRGVYVVELYGNGYRTRSIIRKGGAIIALSTPDVRGHLFKLINSETSKPVEGGGAIFLNGSVYNADRKSGVILVPYSAAENANQKIVLLSENTSAQVAGASAASSSSSSPAAADDSTFASLSTFHHLREQYTFTSSFFLDRESLLAKTRASIVVRPLLQVNGIDLNVEKYIHSPTLRIDTTDDEGVPSTQVIDPFPLFQDQESVHTFTVPDNLRTINITLQGEIHRIIDGQTESASASHSMEINSFEQEQFLEDLYLRYGTKGDLKKGATGSGDAMEVDSEEKSDSDIPFSDATTTSSKQGGYTLYCLGKSGEPIRNRTVNLVLRHVYLREQLEYNSELQLMTDATGAIHLGPLEYITEITAKVPGSNSYTSPQRHKWRLTPNVSYVHSAKRRTITSRLGDTISIPFTTTRDVTPELVKDKKYFMLLKDIGSSRQDMRVFGASFQENMSLVLSDSESSLRVTNLPVGRYLLLIKLPQFNTTQGGWHEIDLEVVRGERVMNEYVLDQEEMRFVKVEKEVPEKEVKKLQIVNVSKAGSGAAGTGDLVIRLNGVTPSTRVHVLTTHFLPPSAGCMTSSLSIATGLPSEGRVLLYDRVQSSYMKQKLLGDEMNYVLQRALEVSESQRIGIMLTRPSLLLNESVKQLTSFSADPTLSSGEKYDSKDVAAASSLERRRVNAMSGYGGGGPGGSGSSSSGITNGKYAADIFWHENVDDLSDQDYDYYPTSSPSTDESAVGITSSDGGVPSQRMSIEFLSQPSVLLTNLKPDPVTGELRVPLSKFNSSHSYASIVAVDSTRQISSYRYALRSASAEYDPADEAARKADPTNLSLDLAYRDTRLMPALNSTKHFSETNLITCLQKEQSLLIADLKTATIESYETLQDYLNLLQILSKNQYKSNVISNLNKFSWLLTWTTKLTQEEKDARYSEFSSHELNIYLYYKDRTYFNNVIQPFLRNKLVKTFIDYFLLQDHAELAKYTESLSSVAFDVLNIFERILLAKYLFTFDTSESNKKATAILDLIIATTQVECKYDTEEYLLYFKTALQSKSLANEAAKASGGDDIDAEGGAMDGEELMKRNGREDRSDRKSKVAAAITQASSLMDMEMECAAAPPSRSFGAAMPCPPPMASRAAFAPQMMMMMSAPAPSMKKSKRRSVQKEQEQEEEEEESCDEEQQQQKISDDAPGGGGFDAISADMDAADTRARKLYQAPPTTKELEERNYYDVSASNTSIATGLVDVNRFWADYCQHLKAERTHAKSHAFLTSHLGEKITTFTDVIFRLAILDLPFEKPQHQVSGSREKSMTFKATAPVILFHKEMKEIVTQVTVAADGSSSSPSPQAAASNTSTPLSISCNYFDPHNLFDTNNPSDQEEDRIDLYVRDEFLTFKVYGCRIVLTNISSNKQKLELLVQIPEGSISVGSSNQRGLSTTTKFVDIPAYSSTVISYLFYFPTTGMYQHYEPSATKKGVAIGNTSERATKKRALLKVVAKPTTLVKNLRDWKWLSQSGTPEEVLSFLVSSNLVPLQLSLVCWRFNPGSVSGDAVACEGFWQKVVTILRERLIYNEEIWSYAVQFQDQRALVEYLQKHDNILSSIGSYFKSVFVQKDISTYEFNEIQHLEYSPLLNARAHVLRVGSGSTSTVTDKKLTIQNRQFSEQYSRYLKYLSQRVSGSEEFTVQQRLGITYYLLLQDRIMEAKVWFETIKNNGAAATTGSSSSPSAASLSPICQLQFDYFLCYFAFFASSPSSALSIAKKYSSYPITKKRKLFKEVENQLMELSAVVDPSELVDEHTADPHVKGRQRDNQDREREQTNLSSTEPTLDWNFATQTSIELIYENVSAVRINFYKIHAELMFSSAPFMLASSGSSSSSGASNSNKSNSFLFVTPNDTLTLTNLPQGVQKSKSPYIIELPEAYRKTNCWIEVVNTAGTDASAGAGNLSVVKPHFAHQMNVQLTQNFGQVKVSSSVTGKPLPSTYIKVYYQPKDNSTPAFYKDGYTDLRGRFDYVSLSTDKLTQVKQFSILVLSPESGALVKLADPPAS